MRTAVRHSLLGSGLLAVLFAAQPLYAQTANSPLPSLSAAPVAAAPSAAEISAGENPPPPLPILHPHKVSVNGGTPDIEVPDSVRDVIDRLDSANEHMTLDDINSAREAVARLDALIDIEKRLADLENLKREREGKSLAAALPASALAPVRPPATQISGAASVQAVQAAMMMGGEPEVLRIAGSDGHFAAWIKSGGVTSAVHVGDRMNDGSTVSAITPAGVELKRADQSTHFLRMKDIGTLASNTAAP